MNDLLRKWESPVFTGFCAFDYYINSFPTELES